MAESSRGGSLAFGQVVIGPPGSGKTTYCHAMREFLGRLGRSVAVVNLDPANEALPCPCALDIGELVTLEDVMGSLGLGPNGGLLYCMDYLAANADWLRQRLHGLRGHYVLFDCPGQVELYTHHQALKDVFAQLAKWNFRVGMGWGSAWQLQAPWAQPGVQGARGCCLQEFFGLLSGEEGNFALFCAGRDWQKNGLSGLLVGLGAGAQIPSFHSAQNPEVI